MEKTYENPSSNISYIGKDFQSIYPELLDLVKKLTNKWDPSMSNESDPGVVLIKELAILGDKLNYNIDKNILECFPLSVTQQGNARKLYEQLGYSMSWYKSAKGSVYMRLKKSPTDLDLRYSDGESLPFYNLPEFTELTDSDSQVVYSTIKAVDLYSTTELTEVECMEGSAHDLTINGEKNITINNLDADLRLYFPESMIAENGIFVKESTSTYYNDDTWHCVDNLISYSARSKIFKFGILPNSNTCYIQFPQDITQIFDENNIEAINIKYLTTSGESGNIKGYTLNSFVNELSALSGDSNESISMNEQIKINQPEAFTIGVDPEDLDEAYRNYKRTVGVFNTLITKRDYDTFIYDATMNNNNLVSNTITSDRTSDINYSNYIQTWLPGVQTKKLVIKEINDKPAMDAFDLNLYITLPSNPTSLESYNETYEPINTENNSITLLQLEALMEDIKSSQHNLNLLPSSSSIKFNININYIIKGLLLTYDKVTEKVSQEISENVRKALYTNCNGRTLDYGEELAYDKLIEIITNADTRIKTFVLNNLSYVPYMVMSDGTRIKMEQEIDEEKQKLNNELIAKMILAGNVQLYSFNDDFSKDFGQTNGIETQEIKTITSNAKITFTKDNTSYTLQENEYIQAYAPNLVVTKEYGVGLKAKSTFDITANTDIYLTSDKKVTLSDLPDNQEPVTLTNVIINSSTDIYATAQQTLKSGESIKVKQINKVKLQPGIPYYFILSNEENRLVLEANKPYILKENEYFIYSGIGDTNELIIQGSGTAIQCEKDLDIKLIKVDLDDNDLTKITEKDLWRKIGPGETLTLIEMQIYNFGLGTKVTIEGLGENETITLNNEPQELDSNNKFSYIIDDDTGGSLSIIEGYTDYKWKLASRLQLNSTILTPQILYENQSVELNFVSGDNEKVEGNEKGKYLQFNNPVILSGGKDLDAKVLDSNGKFSYSLKAYYYDKDPDYTEERSSGYIVKLLNEFSNNSFTLKYNFTKKEKEENSWLIPVYTNIISNTTIKAEIKKTQGEYTVLELFRENIEAENLKGTNAYILQIPLNIDGEEIRFTYSGEEVKDTDYISIGEILELNGYNKEEIDTDTYKIEEHTTQVLNHISNIAKDIKFNWVYKVDSTFKVLQPTDASSYWNINHIYNSYTIPKIDFDYYNVNVNPSNII